MESPLENSQIIAQKENTSLQNDVVNSSFAIDAIHPIEQGERTSIIHPFIMKNLLRTHIIALLAIIVTSCSSAPQETPTPVDKEQDLVMAVTKSSKLYTVQYNVRKIVTFNDITTIKGSLFFEKFDFTLPGDRKVAIPVDATIKGYIDLSQFSKQNININGDEVNITLPDPQIMLSSSKIDHAAEKEYTSWYRTNFSEEEKEKYIKQGVASIMAGMKETDIIERSRINAFNALQPIFIAAGFLPQNIHINFRDEIEKNAHDEKTIFNMLNKD